ncbi:hypothetical protein NQ317_019383 [Molorchus minor]|uniref:Cytochrome P450 n=1 Tax=Molorchus minor TaxID=1323400 RepID=A0ABQ9JEQ9_9CUCU|nr:hypothetical protein NQ317_019383 [Molorchus minor]
MSGVEIFTIVVDLFERAVKTISKYPSPMRFWFGLKFCIIITDVVQAEKIMSSAKFALKDQQMYKFMAEFNGEGLISGSGPKWKRDRRLMMPLFFEKKMLCLTFLIS